MISIKRLKIFLNLMLSLGTSVWVPPDLGTSRSGYFQWLLGMEIVGMAGRAELGWSAWGKQSPAGSVASTARAALAGGHKTEGRGAPPTACQLPDIA